MTEPPLPAYQGPVPSLTRHGLRRHLALEVWSALNKMNDFDRIQRLLLEVRDFINTPRPQHAIMQAIHNWYMLCSALDLVGDTNMAISSYLSVDYPADTGAQHLLLYGLLQALYLHQDGITHIAESLGMPMDLPAEMRDVRDIRNDAVGHPSKRGPHNKPKTFHHVTQVSISKAGFQLMSTMPEGRDHVFRHINVIGLVNKQTAATIKYLQSVLKELKKRESAHRARFRDMKLSSLFPQTMDYYFSKVSEGVDPAGSGYKDWGRTHLGMIIEKYERFKSELERRSEIPASDSLTYNLDQMLYPLLRLREFYDNPNTCGLKKRDALIFVSFARNLHKEMVQIAEEIDKAYDKGSEPPPLPRTRSPKRRKGP